MNRTLVHDTPFALHCAALRGVEACPFEAGFARLAPGRWEGSLLSPELEALFPFDELVLSVDASLPKGSSLEAEVRVRQGRSWSPWRVMGRLDASGGASDPDGPVDVDVLSLGRPSSAFQYRLKLRGARRGARPVLRLVAAAYGDGRPGRPAPPGRATLLDVPARSQMAEDESLRKDVCSPTSLGMALEYWGVSVPTARIAAAVRDRANGIYGNWFLNTAYAGRRLDAFVAKLSSMSELERELLRGRPVVCSIAFGEGELKGAPIPETKGHLLVVRGFDGRGDVVVNDPAASPSGVRRVYRRREFERAWLGRKKGVAYVLAPRFPKELAVAVRGADLYERPGAGNRESQLLLGERVLCVGARGGWAKVHALDQRRDGRPYEGWIEARALARGPEEPDRVVLENAALPAGALVKALGARKVLLPGDRTAELRPSALAPLKPLSGGAARRRVVATARHFLGEPYHWGGLQSARFGRGFDCSGLVTVAYRSAGLRLPRNAHDQWVEAAPVDVPEAGDLVFLSDRGRPDLVTHVMLSAGNGKVVEAEGRAGKVQEVALRDRLAGAVGRRVYYGTYIGGPFRSGGPLRGAASGPGGRPR